MNRLSFAGWAGAIGLALGLLAASPAAAVPAFAVQTGAPCESCHVGGFGPQLTPFGREFKLGGYTLRSNKWNVPLSAMLMGSYVQTKKDQNPPPAPGYSANDNVVLDQISIFVAGGVGSHLGAFIQTTYDGIATSWHWDNLDIRAVTTTKLGPNSIVLGLSFNNAPSVQEAWNALPAWRFPYTTSALQPGPGASPIMGSLAQSTLGITAYTWINSSIYLEGGGYQSPGAATLTRLGADPYSPGNISGVAPYVRLAWQKQVNDMTFQLGAFGFFPNIYPARDVSTGYTDNYADTGFDFSFQKAWSSHSMVTLDGSYTHEAEALNATYALGGASSPNNSLNDLRVSASYYWKGMVGFTVGGFETWGSTDELLYAANRTFQPNSAGVVFQLDGTPFGAAGSPLGPRFNLRMGVQWFLYTEFNGASSNYDGLGANASDNNTFRFFTWLAF